MPSTRELVESYNRGDLGEFLAKTFDGERGRVYPAGDSEVLIVFKSEALTPPTKLIAIEIGKHFQRLGYVVEQDKNQPGDVFMAKVYHVSSDNGFLHINITTKYPCSKPGSSTERWNASMRTTCQMLGV